MNWMEVTQDILVNLDYVKGIARDGERSTIYVELSEDLSEISVNLNYDVLKKIVAKRSSTSVDKKVDEIMKNTRTLARTAYTPVP